MSDFLSIVVFILLAAALFVIPILLRSLLEIIQGVAAVLFVVITMFGWERIIVLLPFAVVWVLGSLCALAMRSREDVQEGLSAHRFEEHKSAKTDPEDIKRQQVLSYLEQKYRETFVIVKSEYIWSKQKHQFRVHPQGRPEAIFTVDEVGAGADKRNYFTDTYSGE